MFTPLQQREIFHLGFLRLFAPRLRPNTFALKGGVNLRFFFQSPRYSEDMDLDIQRLPVHQLKKIVMEILTSKTLLTILQPFQIESIRPPDIRKAKQTETVQRFKVHLVTAAGEDLFTKIEFSRRGLQKAVHQNTVSDAILFTYKQPPLIISHYPAEAALAQKIQALLGRTRPQARDVFDIFILQPQIDQEKWKDVKKSFSKEKTKEVYSRLDELNYKIFSDTVCATLNEKDREYYDHPQIWEIILFKIGAVLT